MENKNEKKKEKRKKKKKKEIKTIQKIQNKRIQSNKTKIPPLITNHMEKKKNKYAT